MIIDITSEEVPIDWCQLYPGKVIIVAITFRQKMHLETVQGKTNLFWLSCRFMKYPHVGYQKSLFFTRIYIKACNMKIISKFWLPNCKNFCRHEWHFY